MKRTKALILSISIGTLTLTIVYGMPSEVSVTAEAISQTPDDTPADQGLLGYLFNRKRTEDGEQAAVGADVPEAYSGPVEELGLIDFLLGKEPQPLVIAAPIPVAKKPLAEPVEAPLPKGGLINYLFNRGNSSPVSAKYTTAVKSAALSEDLLRIKVVLGQLPRSALASRERSNRVARTPKIEIEAPLVENTDPQLELTQKHDSPGPATAVVVERTGLLELLLRRHPDASGVEATRAPTDDNNRD